jgi:proteasome lid subunit RPN8/RPN11
MLYEKLKEFLNETDERVGFVLTSGEVVEVENICPDKTNGFEVKAEDILKYEDQIISSWHTHPGAKSCLSPNDYYGFLNYTNWTHFIVGTEGITEYTVENGAIIVRGRHAY